jgi:large subunit ribosomal protein L17
MRHRKKGRVLGRSPSHRVALLRNLTAALFLTEREVPLAALAFSNARKLGVVERGVEPDDNEPKVKGRIITTLEKAKEVRPLVERCITIAKHGLLAGEDARPYATTAARNSDAWLAWRKGDEWKKWNQAIAPLVNARRRVLSILRDKQAVRVLFETIAPRFADRPGGYTRIMRLAKPRLGDAGTRAILEFVGVRDRVVQRSQAPKIESGSTS